MAKGNEKGIRHDVVASAALFLLAAGLRILYLTELRATPLFHSPGLDSAYYLATARAIAGGHGMGSDVYFMGPLYSYVLAMIGKVTGFSTWNLLLTQSLLGSLGPPLLYLLARGFVSRPAAIAAGALMAGYGMLIQYDNHFLMEWLLTLLGIGQLLVLRGVRATSGAGRPLAAGVLLGVMALGRASLLLVAPATMAWLWLTAPVSAPRRLRLLAYLGGIAVAIAPVTVRNAIVGRDLVLITANGGLNLFIGNNPIGRGTYLPLDQLARVAGASDAAVDISWTVTDPSGSRRVAEAASGRALKPSEVSDFYRDRTVDYVRDMPGRALRILGRKLLLFWNGAEIPQIEDPALYRDLIPLLRLPLPSFGWIAPFALLGMGMAIAAPRRRDWLLLLGYVIAFLASVVVFFVTARYRAPIVPILLIFAVFAAEELVRRARPLFQNRAARSDHGRRLVVPGVALLALAGLVHLHLITTDRSAAYIGLGIALADEGRHAEAIAAFEKAAALAPGDPVARHNLGMAHLKSGQAAEAARVLGEATARFPRSASLWRTLGESEARTGNAVAAAHAFRTATHLEPQDPYLWMRLGGAEFAAGRVDSARSALARGAAIAPEHPGIRSLRTQLEAAVASGRTPHR
jgi:Flp pilus assembly protein TadD